MVEAAVADRRVGEHSDEDRDQTHAHAKLHHRIGLGAEVEVDLDRGGLLHHTVAEGTDLFHIRGHEVIAGLGDPLDVIERTERLHAEIEEVEFQFIGGSEQMLEMTPQFLVGTVDGFTLFAGEFDLRAGLEGDIGAFAFQSDNVPFFFLRFPTERVSEAVQKALDPTFTEIARSPAAATRDPDHLVFGADLPLLTWFAGLVEIVDQLRSVLDDLSRFRAFDVLRHGLPPL